MSTQGEGVSQDSEETPDVGFEINGERYEIPTLDTLTLDEERVLYLYADCVVQDFVPSHPDWSEEERRQHDFLLAQRVRNPNLKRALAHVAYRRRHPDTTDDEILAAIGKVNALELDIAMVTAGEDKDSPPPTSQNEQEHSNGRIAHLSPVRSGSPTDESLGEAAWTHAPTGISA